MCHRHPVVLLVSIGVIVALVACFPALGCFEIGIDTGASRRSRPTGTKPSIAAPVAGCRHTPGYPAAASV